MREADARPVVAEVLVVEERHRHPVGHAVEERDLDGAANARALAQQQRLEDRAVGVEAGRDVAGRDADAPGPFRASGDRRQSALGLNQQIVGAAVAIGTALAVARDVAGDESRVTPAQLLASRSPSAPRRRAPGSG